MFTSSNRKIKDAATKALITVITAHSKIYPALLRDFIEVDDLYVSERVCATGFGAACRDIGDSELREISHAIFEALFASNVPPLNINLRDFLTGVGRPTAVNRPSKTGLRRS